MNPAFENLPEEKKQHILSVCLDEFAKNGYENTSTNKIIERAEISKGLLFHYFKNKKTLYLYLVERSANLISDHVFDKLESIEEEDFFERIKIVAVLKMNVFLKHPSEYHILINGFFNTPEEIRNDITELYQKMYTRILKFNSSQLFDYLKEEQLRDGLSKDFVLEYVLSVMEQYNRGFLQQYKGREDELLSDFTPLLHRLDQYIDILKYGVYTKK